MRVSVIGCGYLGAVHAACMAQLGHDVIGVDRDAHKVGALSRSKASFFEPRLDDLLAQNVDRLRFTTDIAEAKTASVHFIAVGTPQADDSGAADLSTLDAAVNDLFPLLGDGDLVVGKSTVPVGTAERLANPVESTGARLLWNPEFLREGFAVSDTLSPDRLVYGVRPGDDGSVATLDVVYRQALSAGVPRLVTDFATAELVKVAANAFLATKISFINAMAEVAEVTGADVTTLADAIGIDDRIGRRFLNAGVGFGGGCLPKDIRAFQARAKELGVGDSLRFLDEVDRINQRRRQRVVDVLKERLDGSVAGRTIAVLGLAFKPDSDDVRDSPALDIAGRLADLGAIVRATDPAAVESARRREPRFEYVSTAVDAAAGADALVLLTEWPEYLRIDPHQLFTQTSARLVVDGRNCLDAGAWRAAGWSYVGLGRP